MRTIAFNHTMRTAGSTIGNLLRQIEDHKLIKFIKCGHIPAVKCDELLADSTEHIRLSSIREPYDNTVSLFIRWKGTSINNLTKKESVNTIKDYMHEFKECIKRDISAYLIDNKCRTPVINDILRVNEILFKKDGNLAHDIYIRFEHLGRDIDKLLEDIDILDAVKELQMYEILHRKHREYEPIDISQWYDDECKSLVYKLRGHEFEMFDYEN